MILYALFNAAYRVSLHGPGAELEGGGVKHQPAARRVWRRAAARRELMPNGLLRHKTLRTYYTVVAKSL